jgi:NitT/TauT family transport system substrate-binding protein
MLRRFRSLALAGLALVLAVACARGGPGGGGGGGGEPIVLGYSNWAGWWPWAIAVEEKLFEKNGVNVEMKWFDGYVQSMETFAAGKIDGNSQTLNDTISFLPGENGGSVVVLVNDNSAGNDQIIADEAIESIQDLKGKTVAVEEGVVDDFLLSLALEDNGMSRDDVIIKGLPTDQAATAFAAGQVDAVGAFPPYTGTAMKREGAHVIASSKEYPGAIPDLLAVSADLIEARPDDVQKIVQTWWDVRDFMQAEPEKSEQIMARRAGIPADEYEQYKAGTRFFTIADNLEAFSPGEGMQHMPFAAEKMADFMVRVGFIPEKPDMSGLFNDRFIKALS